MKMWRAAGTAIRFLALINGIRAWSMNINWYTDTECQTYFGTTEGIKGDRCGANYMTEGLGSYIVTSCSVGGADNYCEFALAANGGCSLYYINSGVLVGKGSTSGCVQIDYDTGYGYFADECCEEANDGCGSCNFFSGPNQPTNGIEGNFTAGVAPRVPGV